MGNYPRIPNLNNGAVVSLAKVIKHVMLSVTEAELAAMFMNAKEAVTMRNMLEELGHPQPPTPIVPDNFVAK